jgi:hypothetical protein
MSATFPAKEAMHLTSPNTAWPGLHQMPLEAAIGQLLALYQGDSKQNIE